MPATHSKSESVHRTKYVLVFGTAIFLAMTQLAQITLTVKLTVNTQEGVDIVAYNLKKYLVISALWTLFTVVFTMMYNKSLVIATIAIDALFIWWLYSSYVEALRYVIKKYSLEMPSLNVFSKQN